MAKYGRGDTRGGEGIQAEAGVEPRIPLSRQRVLRAAVKIADEDGIGALTMRRLAEELGAEAMSLYYHVAKKEDVLDGVADVVAEEINEIVELIEAPNTAAGWKATVRARILAARKVLLRHPWAPGVLETRTSMGPAMLRYYDRLVGLMRDGGFSYELAHRALHALGSRVLGFTQELFNPSGGPGEADPAALPSSMASQLPHLVGIMTEAVHDKPDSRLGWCDEQAEFEFGLDVILDGLDRIRATG